MVTVSTRLPVDGAMAAIDETSLAYLLSRMAVDADRVAHVDDGRLRSLLTDDASLRSGRDALVADGFIRHGDDGEVIDPRLVMLVGVAVAPVATVHAATATTTHRFSAAYGQIAQLRRAAGDRYVVSGLADPGDVVDRVVAVVVTANETGPDVIRPDVVESGAATTAPWSATVRREDFSTALDDEATLARLLGDAGVADPAWGAERLRRPSTWTVRAEVVLRDDEAPPDDDTAPAVRARLARGQVAGYDLPGDGHGLVVGTVEPGVIGLGPGDAVTARAMIDHIVHEALRPALRAPSAGPRSR